MKPKLTILQATSSLILMPFLLSALDWGVGAKINFAGGPIPALVLDAKPDERWLFNISLGGFPTKAGPIIRGEVNFRYLFRETKRPSYYVQGGYGNTVIKYNEEWQEKKHRDEVTVKDFHINGGISWKFSSFGLSTDVGMFYAPFSINPYVREEYEGVLPIVPIIDLEGIYYIKNK
jgi:hypothetical protein